MPIVAIYGMAIAVLLGLGFAGGYTLSDKIAAGNLAQCELDAQIAYTEQQKRARDRADTAAKSNERALVYAMQRITSAEQQSEELRNEIKKHTTGRDCISSDARGVLQQSKAFATASANRVPANLAGVDRAAAAPAANPGNRNVFARMSTDADMAGWAASVAGLYEQCRSRVESIGLWDAGLDTGLDAGLDGRH